MARTSGRPNPAFFGERFFRGGALYCQKMMQKTDRPAASLDDRIAEARGQLQRTPEWHPEFERRLLKVIHLVDERDARLVAPRAPAAAGGWRCGGRLA